MKNTPFTLFILTLILPFNLLFATNAPELIWSYDFDNEAAFLTEWQTEGNFPSGPWQWTEETELEELPMPGFDAPSSSKGHAYFLPNQSSPISFNVRLTHLQPIDCSAYDTTWLSFYNQYAYFNDNARAFIGISTDGLSYEYERLFENTAANNLGVTSQRIVLNISEYAASESTVYLQFLWIGSDEYVWKLDDMQLFNADPRPATDLMVSGAFFARMPYEVMPAGVDFRTALMIDHGNAGSQPQENVVLTVEVINTSQEVIFRDSITHAFLGVDSVVENTPFPKLFRVPDQPGAYEMTYSISTPLNTDEKSLNNTVSLLFEVTNSIWSHAPLDENILPPIELLGLPEQISYTIGTHYRSGSASGWFVDELRFDLINANLHAGERINVQLLEWEDENGDEDAQANERGEGGSTGAGKRLFIENYDVRGFASLEQVRIPLSAFDTIRLKNDVDYLLMLQIPASAVTADSALQPRLVSLDYTATHFANDSFGGVPSYGYFISDFGSSDLYFHAYDFTAAIYLSVEQLPVYTQQVFPVGTHLQLFPNPVKDVAVLENRFPVTVKGAVSLHVISATGQVVSQEQLIASSASQFTSLALQALPAGAYWLRIQQRPFVHMIPFVKL